jgi:hypothetical protein
MPIKNQIKIMLKKKLVEYYIPKIRIATTFRIFYLPFTYSKL